MNNRPWTPGPWRLTPYYKHTKGGYDIEKKPAPNRRWQGIVEPIPNSEYGCRSFVVGVGIEGHVDDYWLSIKDANARLIAAAPELYDALEALTERAAAHARQLEYPDPMVEQAEAAMKKARGEE